MKEKHVLVLEPDDVSARLLSIHLGELGFSMVRKEDPKEFRAELLENHYR